MDTYGRKIELIFYICRASEAPPINYMQVTNDGAGGVESVWERQQKGGSGEREPPDRQTAHVRTWTGG